MPRGRAGSATSCCASWRPRARQHASLSPSCCLLPPSSSHWGAPVADTIRPIFCLRKFFRLQGTTICAPPWLSQPCRVQPPDNSSISRLQGVRDEAAKPPSRLVGRTRSGILDRSSTSIGSNFASIVAIVASCRLSPEPTQPGEGSDVTHKAPRLHVVHHALQHLALVFTRRYGATGVRPRPCVQC